MCFLKQLALDSYTQEMLPVHIVAMIRLQGIKKEPEL